MGRISDDLLLNPKTNTNGANNLTEWRNFDGTRHSEKLNQITLADMELIPNTAYVYFEFSGTSNVGGNELKVIRNVHVPLKQQNGRLVQFLYNENREVVAEKDYSGNIIRYIRGLGLISSDSENAKTYYHYVCDEQGSVSRIIRGEDKENGAAAQDKVSDRVLNHYEYDAFGNTISCEERVANRFRYQSGKKTGTVWDNITSTADNMPATKIPATFKIDLDGNINYVNPETGTNTLWTNSNATKHMGEYVSRFGDESWSIGTRSQAMLESYSASLNKAMETIGTETPGRYFGTYGNWELGINTETGVVYHARMINQED